MCAVYHLSGTKVTLAVKAAIGLAGRVADRNRGRTHDLLSRQRSHLAVDQGRIVAHVSREGAGSQAGNSDTESECANGEFHKWIPFKIVKIWVMTSDKIEFILL